MSCWRCGGAAAGVCCRVCEEREELERLREDEAPIEERRAIGRRIGGMMRTREGEPWREWGRQGGAVKAERIARGLAAEGLTREQARRAVWRRNRLARYRASRARSAG